MKSRDQNHPIPKQKQILAYSMTEDNISINTWQQVERLHQKVKIGNIKS